MGTVTKRGGITLDPPTQRLKMMFLTAVFLMGLHKVECWFTGEWLESPFFQSLIHSAYWAGMDTEAVLGEAVFLTFIFWLFAGLGMGFVLLWGGRWTLIPLGIWGLTFILEWHHVVRTISRGGYYSGVFTSVVYLAFMAFYVRELLRHVHWAPPPQVGEAA
jgi:hypothetical protein